MEFPHLGTHCSAQDCGQLDFLPFRCAHCSKSFCLGHRSAAAHHCTEAKTKTVTFHECSKCHQKLTVQSTENVDAVMAAHLRDGCKPLRASGCSFPKCKSRTIALTNCRHCHADFCLSHRFALDHACSGRSNDSKSTSASAASSSSAATASAQLPRRATATTNLASKSRLLRQPPASAPEITVSSS